MRVAHVLSAPIRAFVWTLDLCSSDGSPSLAKGIAAAVALVALRDVWLSSFSVLNVSAIALAISAAFGRSAFLNWLNRNTWSGHSSVALTGNVADVVREMSKAAAARRDPTLGIERSGKVPQVHDD